MTADYNMSEVRTSGTGAQASVPLVELTNISKRYGDIAACDNVTLSMYPGQIHGILGENGAGKSTLMKVLIGLVKPDAGAISMNGVVQNITNPQSAARIGFGMVHQHFSLVEELTVWENVLLGEELKFDRVFVDVMHEMHVDFHKLRIDLRPQPQAGKALTDVIDGDSCAEAAQLGERFVEVGETRQLMLFGQFDHDALGRHGGIAQ